MQNYPVGKELRGRFSLVKITPKYVNNKSFTLGGGQWLSGRVLDSRRRGGGFEPHRLYWVVSLSKNINPSLVLVQPSKTRPYITEILLMGCKESNQTNKLLLLGNSIRIFSHISKQIMAFRFMVGPGHCPMFSKYGPSFSKAVGPVDPSFLVVKKPHLIKIFILQRVYELTDNLCR